ncbi:putative PWWP domain, histone H2A deubiquitinase MYSM1, MPN domain-containing protein [Plasmopara halstedii]
MSWPKIQSLCVPHIPGSSLYSTSSSYIMVASGVKKPSIRRLDVAAQDAMKARYEALALVEEQFCDFDIVWAKVHGFPWWPGVLFLSWDGVQNAGIHTDPKIVASLAVPPPEKTPVIDSITNKGKDVYVTKRHCLIMFLDKFNFSLVEMNPNFVASFTPHYHLYEGAVMNSKNSKFVKKKSEFRRAVIKATQLLHMGKDNLNDDLLLLDEPGQADKKRCTDEVVELDAEGKALLDEVSDDLVVADDAALSVRKEKEVIEEERVMKKSRKNVDRKIKMTHTSQVATVNDIEIIENKVENVSMVMPAVKTLTEDNTLLVRKSSQKEDTCAKPTQLLTPTDTSSALEIKKKIMRPISEGSKRMSRAERRLINEDATLSSQSNVKNVHVLKEEIISPKQEAEQIRDVRSDKVVEISEKKESIDTPLSSIWTKGASSDPRNDFKTHTPLAYRQDLVWDDEVFTNEPSVADRYKITFEQQCGDGVFQMSSQSDRSLGKRHSRSVRQSQIRQQMMSGNLDPHTMVQCAAYRAKDRVEEPNSRSRSGATLEPPFQVVIHPDAVFVADVHAHLATCEIIGFLGGKWDENSQTLYIQAAFPCRSLEIDGDDGSTDVEMDPGSEIEVRGIIENAQLEVVGWYHSHPAFAPDPSVRDIENQTSYQHLFKRPNTSKEENTVSMNLEPFVGLIVGTYDTRRNSPVSLFRYFHTRSEKVSGVASREIFMPYELIPVRRHFRNVLQDEEREKSRLFPMYNSVSEHFKLGKTLKKLQHPVDVRNESSQKKTSRLSSVRIKRKGFVRKRKPSSEARKSVIKKTKSARRRPLSTLKMQFNSTINNANHDHTTGIDSLTLKYACENDHNEITPLSTSNCSGISNDAPVVVDETLATLGGVNEDTMKNEESERNMTSDVLRHQTFNDVAMTRKSVSDNENNHDGKIEGLMGESKVSEASASRYLHGLMLDPDARSLGKDGMARHVSRDLDSAAKNLDLRIRLPNSPNISMRPSSTLSSADRRRLPLSTSLTISSRKRTRKPQKTTKHWIRQNSPMSDWSSPTRSSRIHKSTCDNAFKAPIRCCSTKDGAEGATLQPSSSDRPDSDSALIDDVQYFVVDENIDRSTIHQGGASTLNKVAMHPPTLNTTKSDEVQCIVTYLVDQVEKLSSFETKASSDSFLYKLPVDEHVVVNGENLKPHIAMHVKKCENMASGKAMRTQSGSFYGTSPLFGRNRECEDIQTSLNKMAEHLTKLQSLRVRKQGKRKHRKDTAFIPEVKLDVAKLDMKQDNSRLEHNYLKALRTKYGRGVSACTEQVITLVDYYRCFERRTDLNELWKSRITKLDKIGLSLSEYVQFLDIPCALRQDYIKDLISYLRESWTAKALRK